VEMEVYDVRGSRIARVRSGFQTSGLHSLVWDAKGATPGMYVVRLIVDGTTGWSEGMLVGR